MTEKHQGLRISYEDKVLYASGSLITFGSGQTTFDLYLGDDHLRLIIEFSGDETDAAKQKVEHEIIQPDTLRLHFINYNNTLGTFVREPTQLGTIAGRSLWLAYFIGALQGSRSKRLTYSFYLEREARRAED